MKKVNVSAKGKVPSLAPGHDGPRKGNGNGIAIGLSPKQREAVNRTLNVALANAYILLTKTKKAHWDVVGPQFMTLHKLWDEQYTAIANLADETAERIRMLGGFPIGTLQGFLAATELTEDPGNVPTATDGVSMLLHDHEMVVRSLRSATGSVAKNGATPEPPTFSPDDGGAREDGVDAPLVHPRGSGRVERARARRRDPANGVTSLACSCGRLRSDFRKFHQLGRSGGSFTPARVHETF